MAFRPGEIKDVTFRVEFFYNADRIFLKYDKAFIRGKFRVVSKVVDVRSGEHFAESFAIRENNRYYASKGKIPNYIPQAFVGINEIEVMQVRIDSLKDKIPELLPASVTVTYNKNLSPSGFFVTKTLQYSRLKTGRVEKDIFKDRDSDFKKEAVRQIVRAVANFHRAGICHNDIKGDNFVFEIVDGKLEIKIIDYLDNIPIKNENTRTGTPFYFDPQTVKFHFENAANPKNNEIKDSWALGITILRDIYGIDTQWTAVDECKEGARALFVRLLTDPQIGLPDLSIIPEDIQKVVKKLLDKDKTSRITAIQADLLLSSPFKECI